MLGYVTAGMQVVVKKKRKKHKTKQKIRSPPTLKTYRNIEGVFA